MDSQPVVVTEKLRAGSVRIPVKVITHRGRLEFQFPYNKPLMEEIKVMEGSKYHGYDKENPRKVWTVADSPRNRFQLDYLAGRNPYSRWDRPLVDFTPKRPLYKHQVQMARTGLTYHYVIWGAEMGTGKTLAAIEVMENCRYPDWIYCAPKTPLAGAQLEFEKWGSKIKPYFMTYENLVKVMIGWQNGVLPPHGVIFDESSRLKNHTTQRSQAAQHIADNIRKFWGDEGFVIEMSGSPAPKSPVDWWSQCEIVAPGFLREGRVDKFKNRLALYRQAEGVAGGSFPQLVTWWDDERKCKHCGRFQDHPIHDLQNMADEENAHGWEASINEVAYLYKRMAGVVHVFFKKDCLDLPEKRYKLILCPPTRDTLNAMRAISAKSPSTIKTLTWLRELSDGFQYQNVEKGVEQCPLCLCERTTKQQFYVGPEFTPEQLELVGVTHSFLHPDGANHPEWWKEQSAACPHCKGSGEVPTYERIVTEVPTPKEQALTEILEEHEDVGRIVIYGGFTGSIERIIKVCQKNQWKFIRVDGRGWHTDINEGMITESKELLKLFQDKENREEYPRVAFIGQPGAAGMGITLTESPTIVYWSNDFNAESRIQSEDRIHRPGMDVNRGATIIDLIHLPSDKLVLDNLKVKRDLQSLSMGQMKDMLDAVMRDGTIRVV